MAAMIPRITSVFKTETGGKGWDQPHVFLLTVKNKLFQKPPNRLTSHLSQKLSVMVTETFSLQSKMQQSLRELQMVVWLASQQCLPHAEMNCILLTGPWNNRGDKSNHVLFLLGRCTSILWE